MQILCLDIGMVRIGIAKSDELEIIASPLEVYKRTNSINNDAKYIAKLVESKNIGLIVVGLPLKMDGTSGSSVDVVNEFVEKIKKFTNVPIVMQDERFSTVSATNILLEGNVSREKRKGVVDKLAATIILQSFLDKKQKNIKRKDIS